MGRGITSGLVLIAVAAAIAALLLTRPADRDQSQEPLPTPSQFEPPKSTAMKLPTPPELLKRARALAALDLILCPEWEYRYYSFNTKWAEGQMMASMRNGSGDEWWIVFDEAGWTALKGLAHESPAWAGGGDAPSQALQKSCPDEIRDFAHEPAFRWDSTGFCYFRLPGADEWTRANDLTPFSHLDAGEDELFGHLSGSAEDYHEYAADYFETEVPLDSIRHVFEGKPITPELVAKINPEVDYEEIEEELYEETGYPR